MGKSNMIKRADGSYSQRGLWDNIRANKGSGKAPTKEMLKQERKIKAKHADGGTIDNQAFAYDRWKRSLPDNLQNNDPAYNLKGYWEGLNRPEKFQPFEEQMQNDGYYHASTRNPETGEYYKGKAHPTTQHAIDEDIKMGYYPQMKNNKIYTNKFGNGGINNPGFKALPENIQKKILAKMAMGGKVGYNEYVPEFVSREKPLPKFAEAGTVDTGAGISNYLGYAQMAMPIAHMLMPDQQVKDDRGNVVGNKKDTGYAMASKGIDWASKAAVAGPVASLAAGAIGAGVGYFENDANNKKIDKETRLANNSYYNEDTSKAFNTNTGNFTQRRSTNTNMSFAAGGQVVDEDMGNPNAELELNETFRDPMTGEAGMVDGPSHDDGGIEVNLPEGTQIWSDRLKHNGRTFASLTKPIINKIAVLEKGTKDNPNSRFKQNSIKLLNSQLDFFFNVQESNKQQDEMKRTLKKQEGGVVDDMGNYHYADGGIYIKPENRGKFTAYKERTGKTTEEALHSPNAHVRKMANFAKNAAGWKHAMGGTMQYDEGGINGQPNNEPRNNFMASGNFETNPNMSKYGLNTGFDRTFGKNRNLNLGVNANLGATYNNMPSTQEEFSMPMTPTVEPTANFGATGSYNKGNNNFNANVNYNPYNQGVEGRVTYTKKFGVGGNVLPKHWDGRKIGIPEVIESKPLTFEIAEPKLPQVYNSTPYIQPRGNQNPYKGTDITGNKTVGSNGKITTASTPISKMDEFRNRIDSYRNRGKIGQGVTAAMSNITQADRLRSLAAPNKISNVNYLNSMTGPDLVNYGNQRNTIEQGANAVVDKAGRYLGNSGSIMATVNAANLAKQQQLGESYQGQENANAAIMNQALAQKNQASIAQAERNSAIEQENYTNKYGYDAMIAAGLNANDAITASQMGKMFGNDVSFGNDLERSRILGNRYAGKVWNSTDNNTSAENNSQLRESRFGGTIGKYADGGNVYNAKLNAVLNEQSNKNAALMDLEYQQNLDAGNKQFTSKVTGLDYKVLPRSEKDLYAANMWKDTHGTAPTKTQVAATKKAIENKPTSSTKAKEVARSIETWNTQGMTPNNAPKKAQTPTNVPDFANQNTMQYMDQNNMPSFNTPNVEPTRNEIARMMKNVPTYKPGTYKQQATPLFESVPTDKRSKYTPSTAANPEYGNQNTMQYMNQNNMPTNFGPPKSVPNTNTKTIKMNEGLNQNYSDNTRTNLQANKSPKKQDQNIPMLNQKIGKPTIMNQGSDAYNDVKDYAKANETGTIANKKENTRSINTSKNNMLNDVKSTIDKYDINSMKKDQSKMVSKATESALHNIANGFKKPIPTAIRVEIKDILNNQLGTNFKVTEDDFTDSQKAKILELINKKDSMSKINPRKYKNAINTYADYNLIDNEDMNDVVSLWGDGKNIRNTLGEFTYKQKGDTAYIDDIWNLNEKENDKVKKSPIEWYKHWTNKGYGIVPAIPRAAGSAWGSARSSKGDDSKGTKMNIKLYNPKKKS
jgi:hypothetical protein